MFTIAAGIVFAYIVIKCTPYILGWAFETLETIFSKFTAKGVFGCIGILGFAIMFEVFK